MGEIRNPKTNCLQSNAECICICENEHHRVAICSRHFVHIGNRLRDQFVAIVMGIDSLLHFQSGTRTFIRGSIQLPTPYHFEEIKIFHVAFATLYPHLSFKYEYKTRGYEHYRAPRL